MLAYAEDYEFLLYFLNIYLYLFSEVLDELRAGDWDILNWPNFLIFSLDKTRGLFFQRFCPPHPPPPAAFVCCNTDFEEETSSRFTRLMESEELDRLLDKDEIEDSYERDLIDL